MTTRSAG